MIIADSLAYIGMGALFGFTAGISPGPLLALVIRETLTHNLKEGIKVALVPLITDIPVILLSFLILSNLYETNILMSIISFCGALFLIYLGYECFHTKGLDLDLNNEKPKSIIKGITANILNPHPFLFWITVGVPIAIEARQVSFGTVFLFLLTFYLLLTGSKIGIAILVDRSKSFLQGKIYIRILQVLGLSLFIFAAMFLVTSIKEFLSVIR